MALSNQRLISRPHSVIAAEQKRHDRALTRALTAFFTSLVMGGGLAVVIHLSKLLRGQVVLQAALECFVVIGPLIASFVALCRVPPPPFESLGDTRRDLEKKEKQRRVLLTVQVLLFALLGVENWWLWPCLAGISNWPFMLASFTPTIVMVFIAIASLYTPLSGANPDLRLVLDDEVTRSFRARAQRLGYLIMLFITLGFSLLAQINARSAAHYLPLGLAAGSALPVLYFVYLDWQASRSG